MRALVFAVLLCACGVDRVMVANDLARGELIVDFATTDIAHPDMTPPRMVDMADALCAGIACDMGVCLAGACKTCGRADELCCAGAACTEPSTNCQPLQAGSTVRYCLTCGAQNTACCQSRATKCDSALSCVDHGDGIGLCGA